MANIVLFEISTFGRLKSSDWESESNVEENVENCISQLEPPIRTFLNQFKDCDRGRLDDDTYLIMLCTEASRNKYIKCENKTKKQIEKEEKRKFKKNKENEIRKNLAEKGKSKKKKKIKQALKEELKKPKSRDDLKKSVEAEIELHELTKSLCDNEITAGEFLINRLLGNTENKKIFKDNEGYYKNSEDGFEQYNETSQNGKQLKCRIITFGEQQNTIKEAIEKAVKYIRELYKTREHQKLYIAANGGPRDDYLSLITIVKLLKVDNIIPEKILSTVTNGNKIVSADKGFQLLDYAIGLNEFFKSGDASGLQEYFTEVNKIDTEDSLIQAMNDVSKGARYCNAEKIEEGLNGIRDIFFEKKDSDFANTPEFRIFSDSIHRDYGESMLKDTVDNVETIRWCIRKDLLQQALTIAESKTGDDMNQHGILSFEDDDNEILTFLQDKAKNLNQVYKADAPHHMLFDDFKHNMYDNKLMYPTSNNKKRKKKNDKDINVILENIYDKFSDIREIATSSNNDREDIFLNKVERKFISSPFNFLYEQSQFDQQTAFTDKYQIKNSKKNITLKRIPIIKNKANLTEGNLKKAKVLIKLSVYLFNAIKLERNNMNHAGAKMPDPEKLIALLNAYCDVVEALYKLVDPQPIN